MSYVSEIAKLDYLGDGLQYGVKHWYVGLFMNTGSVANEPLKHTISAYSTLAECDAVGYLRKDVTSDVVVAALGNGLVSVTISPSPLWVALPACSAPIACALVIFDPTGANSDAVNQPIYCDTVSFPRTPDGSDFPWLIPANGFLQF